MQRLVQVVCAVAAIASPAGVAAHSSREQEMHRVAC